MGQKNNRQQKVVIYGDSAFAEQVYYQLQTDGRYDVVAFTVDESKCNKSLFLGTQVIPFQHLDRHYSQREVLLFPAIGYSKLNTIREAVMFEIENSGYELLTYISKLAYIGANTKIGEGCYICEFVSIGINSVIGKATIFLPNSRIGHHNCIEDYCYFSNSVSIGGHAILKRNCFVGLHATIRNGVTIEEYNVLGAASNIVKSTSSKGVYVGNPAKRIMEVDLNKFNF